jgi:hypothetical protein
MSSPFTSLIDLLAAEDLQVREAAARELYNDGRTMAGRATGPWWKDSELMSLLGARDTAITVGIAVSPERFQAIRAANGSPRLSVVPPDQDAQEFELHFAGGVALDILTTSDPQGSGAIARYLAKFKGGIQQVEFRCKNVDRVTQILREKFGIAAIYPATRPGADRTRVNFFLLADPDGSKVLIELYETAESR